MNSEELLVEREAFEQEMEISSEKEIDISCHPWSLANVLSMFDRG